MATLRIPITCGEKTCASEPGKFCTFVGTNHFGTVWVCTLFPDGEATSTTLVEEGGWLQRCEACLKHEETL